MTKTQELALGCALIFLAIVFSALFKDPGALLTAFLFCLAGGVAITDAATRRF
jgi:hypothetical protein